MDDPSSSSSSSSEQSSSSFSSTSSVSSSSSSSLSNPQTIRAGRLYFISDDNKEPNWNEQIRYNTNYKEGQIFAQGNVKIVYDQIMTEGKNWQNGQCKFMLMPHTKSNVMRQYTSQIIAGKCEANFGIPDQTTYNYFHVVVEAKQDNNPITLTDTNILVLYVGLPKQVDTGFEINKK
jgi:hypothetical protein